MINLPCPHCPNIGHSFDELASHLKNVHRYSKQEIQKLRGSGWWEKKTPTPEGDKALMHRDAMLRAQAANAINVPFVPPPAQKRTVNLPAGWQKTLEGYTYEKLLSQVHTIDEIIKKVLKGSVIANHAILELYTYRKDVGALSELQDKERMLEAKLAGYVTADPEYPEIAERLYETKSKIRAIKQDIGADVEKETLLEDWYSGDDLGSEEHVEWQEKFMQKALIEAEQVQMSCALSESKVKSGVSGAQSKKDNLDEILKATRPMKYVLDLLGLHPATTAIEVVYQIITNNNKKALNGFLETTAKYLLNSAIQSIKEDKISDIVDISSKYWEDKHVFKDITEKLNLGDSYSDDFRDFYKTSLRNCLNQIYDNVNPIR